MAKEDAVKQMTKEDAVKRLSTLYASSGDPETFAYRHKLTEVVCRALNTPDALTASRSIINGVVGDVGYRGVFKRGAQRSIAKLAYGARYMTKSGLVEDLGSFDTLEKAAQAFDYKRLADGPADHSEVNFLSSQDGRSVSALGTQHLSSLLRRTEPPAVSPKEAAPPPATTNATTTQLMKDATSCDANDGPYVTSPVAVEESTPAPPQRADPPGASAAAVAESPSPLMAVKKSARGRKPGSAKSLKRKRNSEGLEMLSGPEEVSVGDEVDCRDTVSNYVRARVQDVRADAALVHYAGWNKKWDEWVPFSSGRIAPLGSVLPTSKKKK